MGTIAIRQSRDILTNVETVIAIELFVRSPGLRSFGRKTAPGGG